MAVKLSLFSGSLALEVALGDLVTGGFFSDVFFSDSPVPDLLGIFDGVLVAPVFPGVFTGLLLAGLGLEVDAVFTEALRPGLETRGGDFLESTVDLTAEAVDGAFPPAAAAPLEETGSFGELVVPLEVRVTPEAPRVLAGWVFLAPAAVVSAPVWGGATLPAPGRLVLVAAGAEAVVRVALEVGLALTLLDLGAGKEESDLEPKEGLVLGPVGRAEALAVVVGRDLGREDSDLEAKDDVLGFAAFAAPAKRVVVVFDEVLVTFVLFLEDEATGGALGFLAG